MTDTITDTTDIETNLITMLLLAPEWAGDVSWLKRDDFRLNVCADSWDKLLDTVRQGGTPNPFDYSRDFQPLAPPPLIRQHLLDYAERIAKASLARRGLRFGGELAKACYANDTDAIRQYAADADTILSLSNHVQESEVEQAAKEIHAELADPTILCANLKKTWIAALDRRLAGVDQDRNITICGRPGSGKTAAILQILDLVTEAGDVAKFFSEEMTTRQVLIRMACRRAKMNWEKVKRNEATPKELAAIDRELKGIENRKNLFIYSTKGRKPHTTDEISDTVEKTVHRYGRIDWVMGDHASLFGDAHENEVLRLGLITNGFKQIANRFSTRAVVAAQLNRKVEERANKRPMLSDVRDSGKIEENSDVVIALYRERYYNPKADMTAEMALLKNRDGGCTIAKMIFLEETGSFEEIQNGR